MSTYARLKAEMRELYYQMIAALKREYPEGTIITYAAGKHIRTATVIDHSGCDDRVKVVGHATGKEYWIAASRIIGTDEEEE